MIIETLRAGFISTLTALVTRTAPPEAAAVYSIMATTWNNLAPEVLKENWLGYFSAQLIAIKTASVSSGMRFNLGHVSGLNLCEKYIVVPMLNGMLAGATSATNSLLYAIHNHLYSSPSLPPHLTSNYSSGIVENFSSIEHYIAPGLGIYR